MTSSATELLVSTAWIRLTSVSDVKASLANGNFAVSAAARSLLGCEGTTVSVAVYHFGASIA